METLLVSATLLPFSTLNPISTPPSLFHFRSFPPKPPLPLPRNQRIWNSKKPIFIASASNFGGWDELESYEDPVVSGELEQFRKFLISIGIDDRKHVYLFLAGFVSALVIARVRFSSIVVFPAFVLLFFVGYSIGIARRGNAGIKNGSLSSAEKESGFSVTAEKLRSLRDSLGESDVKMSELKIRMEGVVDSNRIEIGEIKRYQTIVESVRVLIMSARGVLGTVFGGDSRPLDLNGQMGILYCERDSSNERAGDLEAERNLNDKSSRRERELDAIGFGYFQSLIGRLFQKISVGLKPHKVKGVVKQESNDQMNSVHVNSQLIVEGRNGSVQINKIELDGRNGCFQINKVEDGIVQINKIEVEGSIRSSNYILGNFSNDLFPQEALKNPAVNRVPEQDMVRPNENVTILSDPKMKPSYKADFAGSGVKAKMSKALCEGANRSSPEMAPSDEIIFDNAAPMINGKQVDRSGHQSYRDDMLSFDDGLSTQNIGLQFSNEHRNFQKLGLWNQGEAHTPHGKVSVPDGLGICQENGKLGVDNGMCSQSLREELGETTKLQEKAISNNHIYMGGMEQDEEPSSSTVLDDEFTRHLKEANGLLKKAREDLIQVDDEMTEILLCKSASLLSRALKMEPTSLQAVGQLGNTFLLHGELKLKKSRELRALLSRSDCSSTEKGSRVRPEILKYEGLSKDKITSVLVNVCEECEELLIEAGRKYRMALSIDGNDVRALYNWGLALSFRGQLIADVGPEAALDADKVYLAAIDKFDAMVSKSNAYTPDALFRWGVALQLRSHLRPSSSKEKLKLLHQAKRLLEDALRMDSDNPQVRKALSSCIAEINCRLL
eukprot:TRINITY_DN5815_c0_g1_i2.p1 TRINITY_DN5815_c0_g1~~TRINITY_DN5815_c0_g1_i2.p1  ORF type:complete len:838 (-),score=142.54 TRINITY_DN5815_c0_g1_i2:124-2637(-)